MGQNNSLRSRGVWAGLLNSGNNCRNRSLQNYHQARSHAPVSGVSAIRIRGLASTLTNPRNLTLVPVKSVACVLQEIHSISPTMLTVIPSQSTQSEFFSRAPKSTCFNADEARYGLVPDQAGTLMEGPGLQPSLMFRTIILSPHPTFRCCFTIFSKTTC